MNIRPSRMQCSCPTCGANIGEAADLDAVREAVTAPIKRNILDELSRRPGKPVRRDHLIAAVYGHRRDGGSERVDHAMQVHVCQLRNMIEPFGWTISTSKGAGTDLAQWRLIPMEAGA